MSTDVIGTNDELIDELVVELNNYEDQISDIFNNMEDSVAEALSSFKCTSKSIFSQKFDNLKKNFSTIKSNLESYQKDFILAKDSNARINEVMCKNFEKSISDLSSNAVYKNNGGV